MSSASHQFPIDIKSADIDFMGHVNNAIYLEWVQNAVVSHWNRIATPEAIATYVWVAIKHEIAYRKPAFLADKVVAVVTLEQVRRQSAFYETIISREEDILAFVKSRWCCLDAKTLRPTRLASDIVNRFIEPSANKPLGQLADANA